MTIFGSDRLVPTPIIVEKVLESALRGIKGMLQKRQIQGSGIYGGWINLQLLILFWLPYVQFFEQYGEYESSGIVVGGISLCAVRNCKDRVL
jgi:hypothetical protein